MGNTKWPVSTSVSPSAASLCAPTASTRRSRARCSDSSPPQKCLYSVSFSRAFSVAVARPTGSSPSIVYYRYRVAPPLLPLHSRHSLTAARCYNSSPTVGLNEVRSTGSPMCHLEYRANIILSVCRSSAAKGSAYRVVCVSYPFHPL